MESYKLNLLQNVRHIARQVGGNVRLTGKGIQTHVSLSGADGRTCVVWYPLGAGRVNGVEVADLKDACKYIFGRIPFKEA